ncbi:Uncharacterized protein AC511_2972 [Pseudomonas coronafaciens pv. oryzae]|nr:Uncharacterized protein AC511_2972 [Pseudomonas coronafaciens pv. oryzae]
MNRSSNQIFFNSVKFSDNRLQIAPFKMPSTRKRPVAVA